MVTKYHFCEFCPLNSNLFPNFSLVNSFNNNLNPCGAIREGADDLECYSAPCRGFDSGRDLREISEISAEYKIILKSGVGEMITPAPVP